MKKTNKEQQALDRLADALVDDVFNASDEEILAERTEMKNLSEEDAKLKALFEQALLKANKSRLAAAKAGAAANQYPIMRAPGPIFDIATARERIRALVKAVDPSHPITLAARNENELSDTDILSMYEDLVELGVVPPITED
ncbi:hypothetical protein [Terricaulis sp.]|uniref:hypothetical protein n=1 Tax=Terricaulis sp. TaxID=2768686 RepID=UPI002AC76472|nr:hypothetical protein [Terricaulis sp.]MDZ4690024.1 hypothetical protein [Terricaulis sp.]